MPWKNGGGITREVAKATATAERFRWRVSIAEVSGEGPFSTFAGYRRWIAVIDGQGMALRDARGGSTPLKPFQPHAFDGGDEIHGALPSGAVSDLNVIFQPGTVRASLRFSEEAQRLRSAPNGIVLVINVDKNPVAVGTNHGMLELVRLDGVLAANGAALDIPAGQRCAVIELQSLNDEPFRLE